jgi:hypothetical protein
MLVFSLRSIRRRHDDRWKSSRQLVEQVEPRLAQRGIEVPSDGRPSAERTDSQASFEIYVERGKQPGGGVADWLQAEREYHERS